MAIDILKKSNKSKFWEFLFSRIIRINLSDLISPKIFLFKINDFNFEIKNFYQYAEKNPITKDMSNLNDTDPSNHD